MSDDGGYKFQASFKYGPHQEGMINLRANDPDEIQAWMSVTEQLAGPLMDLIGAYSPPRDEAEAIQNFEDGGITGEVYQGKVCAHGNMVYKTGQGARGPWAAWMCPAPKGSPGQCQPVDAKTGRPWPKR